MLSYSNYPVFYKDFAEWISKNLDKKYSFFTFEYCEYLMDAAWEIGKDEKLTNHDWEIVNTAILLLYSGKATSYKDFLENSVSTAKQVLKQYAYPADDIKLVVKLLNSLAYEDGKPSILQKIFLDSYQYYYADDMKEELLENLYRDQRKYGQGLLRKEFIAIKNNQIRNTVFLTEYGQKYLQPKLAELEDF
ncbi:MAG: hypothetical protein H6607_12375 [Flavobacteriales bacterium]|nr:hypothetical protein [Flavobacteriales bacterium]